MNKDVERFKKAIPADRRPLFDKLEAIILGLYPKAEVVISYQVPTYKAKFGWVSLNYWKDGISLLSNRPQLAQEFKAKHPDIQTGVASLKFKVTDKILVGDVKKFIKGVIENPAGPYKKSGA